MNIISHGMKNRQQRNEKGNCKPKLPAASAAETRGKPGAVENLVSRKHEEKKNPWWQG
jgi:hypothetical protein